MSLLRTEFREFEKLLTQGNGTTLIQEKIQRTTPPEASRWLTLSTRIGSLARNSHKPGYLRAAGGRSG
ncbi:hypothetical protein NFI96_008747, partial [Prochilodus magdalenae]